MTKIKISNVAGNYFLQVDNYTLILESTKEKGDEFEYTFDVISYETKERFSYTVTAINYKDALLKFSQEMKQKHG